MSSLPNSPEFSALRRGALVVRVGGQWKPATSGVHRWVAVPGMNALGAHLAADLPVHRNTMVVRIERAGQRWRLTGGLGDDLGSMDVVLACVPSPQALQLVAPAATALAQVVATAEMHPTWATMLVLAERAAVPWDGAFLIDVMLVRVSRGNTTTLPWCAERCFFQ